VRREAGDGEAGGGKGEDGGESSYTKVDDVAAEVGEVGEVSLEEGMLGWWG
jgi:hypothetical protein